MMNEKTAFEIERKYLIGYPDTAMLEKKASRKIEMIQTYITGTDGSKIRIRSCLENGKHTYIKTVKKAVTELRRIETEGELSEEEYLSLLNGGGEKRQLTKTRYCVQHLDQLFEIDVYPFWKDKAIIEIELSDENDRITFPDFVKIIKEVSEDKKYRNYSLAEII